jgi:hypothetical protein
VTEPRAEQIAVTGLAQDAKAGAVLSLDDGRVLYVSGLDAWPAGVAGLRVAAEGTLVVAARLPRATQGDDGAWSQGVAPDSAGESWLDGARWSLVGPDPAPWTITISDGSANVTVLTQPANGPATWVYRPVSPAESSSGVYSGGAPANGTLAPAQVVALWDLVRTARGDASGGAREKGTVHIATESAAGTRRVTVARGAAEAIDTWVRSLRGP